jgi:hypothetical protein
MQRATGYVQVREAVSTLIAITRILGGLGETLDVGGIVWRRLAQKPRCDILLSEVSTDAHISLFVRTSNRRQENRSSSVYLSEQTRKCLGNRQPNR